MHRQKRKGYRRKAKFPDWPSSDRPDVVDAGTGVIHPLAGQPAKLFMALGKQGPAEECGYGKAGPFPG